MKCRTFAIGMLLVGMAVVSSALADEDEEVVAMADSSVWSLDTTLDDTSTVVKVGRYGNPIPIAYSGNWSNPADSGAHTVRIQVDGMQPVALSGEGTWPCTLEAGRHSLAYSVDNVFYASRQFVVEGLELQISVGGNWTCAISASVDDAVIYYTTDGSEPTRSSRVYTGTFTYDPEVDRVVWAMAVADGFPESNKVKSMVLPAYDVEDVESAADSSEWSLDTRAGNEPLPLERDARISYSGLWSSDPEAMVTVAVDGSWLFSTSGEGVFIWPRPAKGGIYTLTHTTMKSGEQVGETLTAQFAVPMSDFDIDDGTDGAGGAASSFSYVGVYDGGGHGIAVDVHAAFSNPVIKYALDRNGEYVDNLLLTNACDEVAVWYTVEAEGYNTYTNHATVTIAKATYDLTNVAWDYAEPFTYDGTTKRVALVGLPEGVSAKYADNEKTEAGEYIARTSLVYDTANYQVLAEIPECHWTIESPPVPPGGNDEPVPPGGDDEPVPPGGDDEPVPPGGGDEPVPPGGGDEPVPPGGNDEPIPPGGDDEPVVPSEHRRLWYADSVFNRTAAEVYQGYLLDANETVAGTVELKVGKPNKFGVSKVTAKVQVVGAKKEMASGATSDGSFTATTKSGLRLNLRIGADGLSGTCGSYEVDGARNVFKAWDMDSKAVAAQVLRAWQGTYVLAIGAENGYAGISLEVGRKGAVKISGMMPDGQKLSGKAQLLVGERDCAIAVTYSKKASSIAFMVWLGTDGTIECSNLSDPNWEVKIAAAKMGPQLLPHARFRVDGPAMAAKTRLPLLVDLLPDGVAVKMVDGRFVVAKAGRVKLLQDKNGVDETALGENPSALKLTCTSRNSFFKGSFIVYAFIDGKLKKYKAAVTGVVLESVGYGMATVKGLGSFPVTIE